MKLAYIIGTYPLLTTTFIEQEIEALRAMGADIEVFSIRRPPPMVAQVPKYRALQQEITYLLPADWCRLILAHLWFALLRPVAFFGLLAFLLTRPHPGAVPRFKTLLHFAEGVYAAYLLQDRGREHVHAHFIDRAATVALCVGRLLKLPYSLTAHANDIYVPQPLVPEKLGEAAFAVTVSEFNKSYLLRHCPRLPPDSIVVLHPWVDLSNFQPPAQRPERAPLRILSVGRMVEKKGHRYLIEACRLLRDGGADVECQIVGDGPLMPELRALVERYGLSERVQLPGALPRSEVMARLHAADVFALACVVAPDGDRDGMPVALAEAMACELPVISTALPGLDELVRPDAGYLVPPGDPLALARAIRSMQSLGADARAEIGWRGRAAVAADFELFDGTRRLADLFRRVIARHTAGSAAFVVWGPPSHGPRSRVLARELGIDALHYIHSSTRRGPASAPLRYAYQAVETLRVLLRDRPRLVFVQSPPGFAVLFVALYCRLAGARYLVDAHSAAMQLWFWNRPAWLYRLLARRALATIVTNQRFQRMIEGRGGRAFVLRDIPTRFERNGDYPLDGGFSVAVVNTFADDEPLGAILDAARELPDVRFYVTGKTKMAPPGLLERAPPNVRFTGFLPDGEYYSLLDGAHAVLCMTTRDHTMQRGACEALSLGKPIITSDWPLLRSYFRQGAAHVPNTSMGIRQGVLMVRGQLPRYQAEIAALRDARRQEWQANKRALLKLIRSPEKLSEEGEFEGVAPQ